MYRVVDWEKHFENNRTKELKKLSWVPMPNRHDGDGYTELADHKNGAAHYGIWCAIVQVASKCDPRGTLSRDGARPHTSATLSRMISFPASLIDEALSRLVNDVRWLEVIEDTPLTESRTIPQASAGIPQDVAALQEQKGMEGKGIERNPPVVPPGDGMTPQIVFDKWNALAVKQRKLRGCRKLTPKRQSQLRTRLAEDGWFNALREAVQVLPLGGDGWQPGLDWLIRNGQNVYRLLEGEFDWRITDDPALRKLEQVKRKRAAKESEAAAAQQKRQERQQAPQLRNAIAGILPLPNGDDDGSAESSLLSGPTTTSSANGAGDHKIQK